MGDDAEPDGRILMIASRYRPAPDVQGQPRCRHRIDCFGAQLHVHTRSVATVLHLDGEIDASNADLVGAATRGYSRLQAPLILDLSRLDFLGVAGFRTLLALNDEHRHAHLYWSVVGGTRLRRLTRVFTDHGLPVADSVPEALRLVDELVRSRRQCLSGAARQPEPQRESRNLRVVVSKRS